MEICTPRRTLLIVALFLLIPASTASAQAAVTLDAAATRISYAEGSALTGLSIAPGFQLVRPWQLLTGGGAVTRFPGDVWSYQGYLAGSAYLGPVGGLRPELEGRIRGTRHEDGGGSSELAGAARLHWIGAARGLWIGASGGRSWDGLDWRGSIAGSGGGWAQLGPGILSLAVTGTRINDALRYGEAESAFRMDRGPLELVAYGGIRHWFRPGDASADAWGGGTLAWWIGERLAITASGGAYPTDYAQGLPSGAFGSLGIRLATGRLSQARRANEPLDLILPPARPGASGLALERMADGSARITISGLKGTQVELMGDFTGWEPIALELSGENRWTTTLPVPPGVHRVNVRVDGGAWRAPAGIPSSTDEFGGAAGLLIVE